MRVEIIDNMTARINRGNAFCICILCRRKCPIIKDFLMANDLEQDAYSLEKIRGEHEYNSRFEPPKE